MGNRTKNQHFVPRFYLRNFCANREQETIWVLNKLEKSIYTSKIEMTGSKNNLFANPIIEKEVTAIENIAQPNYAKAVKRLMISNERPLKRPEKEAIAILISLQWWRTRIFREFLEELEAFARNKLADKLMAEENLTREDAFLKLPIVGAENMQSSLMLDRTSIFNASNFFVSAFNWEVGLAADGVSFVTSDHPVAAQDPRMPSLNQEITFPLSSRIILILRRTSLVPVNSIGLATKVHAEETNYNQLRTNKQFLYSANRESLETLLSLL